MRAALILVTVLGVTLLDAAAGAGAQSIGLPLPSLGLPLPEIGLPLPSLGLPPPHNPSQSVPRATPPAPPAHPPAGHGHSTHSTRTFVYVVPAYGWPGAVSPLPEPPAPAEATPPQEPIEGGILEPQPDADPRIPIDDAPSAAREAEPPPPPSTIYLIPGCYIGNLPPRDVTLPAGCDPNRALNFPSSQ